MLTFLEISYAFQVSIFVTVFMWCMDEGQVLHFYQKWLEKKRFEWQNGDFWTKPLGLCSFCFSFWVSLLFGVFIIGFYPIGLILFCFIVMFIDRIRTKYI